MNSSEKCRFCPRTIEITRMSSFNYVELHFTCNFYNTLGENTFFFIGVLKIVPTN